MTYLQRCSIAGCVSRTLLLLEVECAGSRRTGSSGVVLYATEVLAHDSLRKGVRQQYTAWVLLQSRYRCVQNMGKLHLLWQHQCNSKLDGTSFDKLSSSMVRERLKEMREKGQSRKAKWKGAPESSSRHRKSYAVIIKQWAKNLKKLYSRSEASKLYFCFFISLIRR